MDGRILRPHACLSGVAKVFKPSAGVPNLCVALAKGIEAGDRVHFAGV